MDFFTQKEKDCLTTYVTDLLRIMDEDNILTISDSHHSYEREEILILSKKIARITPVIN